MYSKEVTIIRMTLSGGVYRYSVSSSSTRGNLRSTRTRPARPPSATIPRVICFLVISTDLALRCRCYGNRTPVHKIDTASRPQTRNIRNVRSSELDTTNTEALGGKHRLPGREHPEDLGSPPPEPRLIPKVGEARKGRRVKLVFH